MLYLYSNQFGGVLHHTSVRRNDARVLRNFKWAVRLFMVYTSCVDYDVQSVHLGGKNKSVVKKDGNFVAV